MVTGELLDHAAAAELGLLNRQFPADSEDEFLDKVLALAATFCPPGRASMAVGLIKRSVQSGLEMGLEQGLALERELQARLFASDDAREGLSAYVGRRTPEFTGK